MPLFPVFIIFFIGSIAETNRAPFDLAEAESELVSGFMTEHAAVIFVFFFLAEYGSILLMCILSSILFIGGYLSLFNIMYIYENVSFIFNLELMGNYKLENNLIFSFINGLLYSINLGLKSSLMVFV